jgi:site-specific DNA-methyltransferase (adenine-specific)
MTVELYLGDCLEYMKSMPAGSVDAVITDPPYGIGLINSCPVGGRNEKHKDVSWDIETPNKDCFIEIERISKTQIIWGANYLNCFRGGGAIVWDKLQPLPDSSQCEIASVSGYKKVFKYTQRWTNFVNTKETDHPTEKPILLFIWLLENFTKLGDTIFDPFMGSGTTGVACMQLGRNFIGCEIDPKYFAIAEKRIKNASLQPQLFPSASKNVEEKQGDLL